MLLKILKAVVYPILLFLLYGFMILLHGGVTDYQPEKIIALKTESQANLKTINDSTLSFLIWNIGYAGLGAEADFFYHGSGFFSAGDNMVRPTEALNAKFFNGINDFIKQNPSDFILLQEVDFESKRSYYTNQFEEFQQSLPEHAASKATNFKVGRVPAPILQPWNAYGKCYSGLATFSKYQPKATTRYQLPGSFEWPNKPFMLDRCLQVSRFPFFDKELVVVNVHNTAYEKDGKQKMQQLDFLKELILPEYEKGNYVIAGGDWNQSPPGFPRDHFKKMDLSAYKNLNVPGDLFPADWEWVFDPEVATNRSNRDPFEEGETFTTLIDFYLLSPNLKALSVKGMDMNFAFSDHQPVLLELEIEN